MCKTMTKNDNQSINQCHVYCAYPLSDFTQTSVLISTAKFDINYSLSSEFTEEHINVESYHLYTLNSQPKRTITTIHSNISTTLTCAVLTIPILSHLTGPLRFFHLHSSKQYIEDNPCRQHQTSPITMFLHRRKTELLLLIAISSSTSPQVSAFTTISIPTCRQSLALQTFTSRVEEESLLEDGEGHINRELAERIWNWEQQKRQDKNLPKFPYSTRGGLRMVNDIVHELMVVGGKGVNADDLVQEGM